MSDSCQRLLLLALPIPEFKTVAIAAGVGTTDVRGSELCSRHLEVDSNIGTVTSAHIVIKFTKPTWTVITFWGAFWHLPRDGLAALPRTRLC
jgi:hypothetical protein